MHSKVDYKGLYFYINKDYKILEQIDPNDN